MIQNQLRDALQEKWATEFMEYDKTKPSSGILHLCPRAGKIRTSIRIFCKIQRILKRRPRILIAYPDKNIQISWEDDILAVDYKNPVEYVTHVSLGKVVRNNYDIIVCDEVHLLSEKQKENLKDLIKTNKKAYGIYLSGTLSKQTKSQLNYQLGLKVISEYPLEQAIKDGIISDYIIHVVHVNLDNIEVIDNKNRTEKKAYNAYTWVIDNKGPNMFLSLARMKIVNNSVSKINKTREILNKLKDERVLVFCASNKVAKELGCEIHTALNSNQTEFEKFIKNKSSKKHYAVCKIGNTGVSFKKLSFIIVNSFDSNGENLAQRICRSLILDEKNKVSTIYIISTKEKAELTWLRNALEFFNPKKIIYDSQITTRLNSKRKKLVK